MFTDLLTLLAAATAAIFAVPRRWKYPLTLLLTVCGCGACLWQAIRAAGSGVPLAATGRSLLFGEELFRTDALSALFLAVVALSALAVTIYAKGYVQSYGARKTSFQLSLHYAGIVLLFLSMAGVVTADGGYPFLFCWEGMTLASFALILFDADHATVRRAAVNYLMLMHLGFILLLAGFVTLSADGLTAGFSSLPAYFAAHRPLPLFLVFLAGFGMKAGLFPLHAWLPEAHPAAPAHISALMSGVMIKMGVYGILRVGLAVQDGLLTIGIVLLALGAVSALGGSVFAAVQGEMKRLLAYSSIENVGIILMGLGLALIGKACGSPELAACALCGALLHTVNHAFFKASLFFGAGNIYTQTHTLALDRLGGLVHRMPVTAACMLVGTAAVCALPPLSGFVSEFLIALGALKSTAAADGAALASTCALVAMALTGGIVLLAFTKMYGIAFQGHPRSAAAAAATEVDPWRRAALFIPVAGIVAVGVAPTVFLGGLFDLAGELLGMRFCAPYYAYMVHDCILGITLSALLLCCFTAALLIWKQRTMRRRTVAASPTWGCGFGAVNTRMQYTGESYAEGIERITGRLTGHRQEGQPVDKAETFARGHAFRIGHGDGIDRLLRHTWLETVRIINRRVMRWRTGKVNHYISYALAFMLLILLLSLFNLI